LVGFRALGDAPLEQLPVDPGRLRLAPLSALALRRRGRPATVVGQHLEAHPPGDVTRPQDRLVARGPELPQPHRRGRDPAIPPPPYASSSSSFLSRTSHTSRSPIGALATSSRAAATEAARMCRQRAWQRRLSRCRRNLITSANLTTSPTASAHRSTRNPRSQHPVAPSHRFAITECRG